MLAPWYLVLAVVLLPLALTATRRHSVWPFAAAGAGFGLLALADCCAATGRLRGLVPNDPYLQDMYYVVAHTEYTLGVAAVFRVLAMGQWLKQRFDREDRRWTRDLLWVLVLSVIGTRLVATLAHPFAMPRRYVDAPADLGTWMAASQFLSLVSVATFLGLVGLIGVVPFWRGAAAGRRGGR